MAEENNTHHEPICPPDCQRKRRYAILDESVQGISEKVDGSVECQERKSPNRLNNCQGTEEEHDCSIDEQENSHAIGINGPCLVEEKNAISREDDHNSIGNR